MLQLNASHSSGEEPTVGRAVLQEVQNSSAHSDSQRWKGSCSYSELWRKHHRRGGSQAFGGIKKSWWTECILGQALPAGALTFQNWKKTNQTKKPQSLTTASCANVRVQVACGWSNFSFLYVTFFLSGEKLDSPVALPPCWLIYSLWLAFVSRKAVCHFFCPWQRPLSVTQQPSKSLCQLICSTWKLLMPPAWKPFCRHCRFAR